MTLLSFVSVLVGANAVLYMIAPCCCFFRFAVILNTAFLVYFNYDFLKIVVKTFPRDLKGLRTFIALEFVLRRHMYSKATVAKLFRDIVKHYPEKDALISIETGKAWTFTELEAFSNQVANYFSETVGLKEGDVLALYMPNCPEYIGMWLGLSKIGVVTALINNNLKLEPLAHSIHISEAKCIVVGADLEKAFIETANSGLFNAAGTDCPIFVTGALPSIPNAKPLDSAIEATSRLNPTVMLKSTFKSTLFLIYTSGTTGLPKAAKITHARFFFMAYGVHLGFSITPSDRLYIHMPLYHSAAGILASGQTVLCGCTSVIRKKFSASNFWDECIKFNCTVSQYIGEIARYLLVQPLKPSDRNHAVRMMFGNGLRPNIWTDFCERFGIAQIGEFYGSTEGNTSLLNVDSRVGACGFLPVYNSLQSMYPICLIKVDETTGDVERGPDGLCLRCRPGETGEIVCRIVRGSPVKDFVGYVSDKDTSKKCLKNVFKQGDEYFASGDVLYMDKEGYVFFKDRTGDTFRWKGENVSTAEIEAVIQRAAKMNDATAYGVEIPGLEGRAGMAAIVDENENCNLVDLAAQLRASLPPYARPCFIRLCQNVDMTGTYKLKKTDLRKEAFDPSKVKTDRLFYLEAKTGNYLPLTADIFNQINEQKIKF